MRGLNRRVFIGCVAAALVGAAAAATLGCASNGAGGGTASSRSDNGSAFGSVTPQTLAAARTQAQAAADAYMTILVQADDQLRARTRRPEVLEWSMEQRIATAVACYTNVTGANDFAALLDMMVYATLKRYAIEEYWIPTLLYEDGAPLLEASRRGEREVWQLGAKVLTPAQLDELRRIIEDWRRANPTQYYVSHVHFTDFADAMQITPSSPKANLPNSVFGMLYIDPLAGLDPVAKELQQYRALTERLLYLGNRMPIVLQWQVELAVSHATGGTQVVRFVNSTSRFADATTRFSEEVGKIPQTLATERNAAIEQLDAATTRQVKATLDQMFAGITQQREAINRDLDAQLAAQESRARGIISDVRGVVDRADEAGKSVNAATSQTVNTAEQSARRTMDHAFLLAITAVVVTLVSLLLYRLALKRWLLSTA